MSNQSIAFPKIPELLKKLIDATNNAEITWDCDRFSSSYRACIRQGNDLPSLRILVSKHLAPLIGDFQEEYSLKLDNVILLESITENYEAIKMQLAELFKTIEDTSNKNKLINTKRKIDQLCETLGKL